MTTREEESSIIDSKKESGGSGRRLKALRSSTCQRIGKKLEVKVFKIDEEVAKIVGKSFVDKIVEVDHLEDFYWEEKGIRTLKDEDYHDHYRDPAEYCR